MANVLEMTIFLTSYHHPLYRSTNVSLAFIARLLVLNVLLCFPENRCRKFHSWHTHFEFFLFFSDSGKSLGFPLHSCVFVREGKWCPVAPSLFTVSSVDFGRMVDKSSSSTSLNFTVKLATVLQLRQYYF